MSVQHSQATAFVEPESLDEEVRDKLAEMLMMISGAMLDAELIEMVVAVALGRLDPTGKWSDIRLFQDNLETRDGAVLNWAINLRAVTAALLFDRQGELHYLPLDMVRDREVMTALDTDRQFFDMVCQNLEYDLEYESLCLFSSEIPRNSGLGGSAAYLVSLVGALSYLKGLSLDILEVISRAIDVEQRLIKAGIQDEVRAGEGGAGVVICPTGLFPQFSIRQLDLSFATKTMMEKRTLPIFTGVKRESSDRHAEVMAQISQGEREGKHFLGIIEQMADNAELAANFLEAGDWTSFQRMPARQWKLQCELDTDAKIKETNLLEGFGRRFGAVGVGMGAAGGGTFTLFFPDDGTASRARRDLENGVLKEIAGPRACILTSEVCPHGLQVASFSREQVNDLIESHTKDRH